MFTGIVQGTARVLTAEVARGVLHLTLELPEGREGGLVVGGSVSIGGTCLTAVAVDGRRVDFDVIGETLDKTTLGDLRTGSVANVERAARFGDEIGGHLLSGHVIGTLRVARRDEVGDNLVLGFAGLGGLRRYVLPKGFVAVDGCSLTIGHVDDDGFLVHLIPETRRVTTLGALRLGDRVNLEIDAQTQAVVDTVERVLSRAE